MSFDASFPNRVAMARNSLGFTQAELAKKVGVVARQIAAYEGGEAKPRERALVNLASALGTTSEWLALGKGNGPEINHIKKTVTVPLLPLYGHIQVCLSGDSPEISESSAIYFIPCPEGAGEKSFAFIVQGDSMTCDGPLSFPSDTIVTVDPDVLPAHGDFGLFILKDSSEATFKQLVLDQGRQFLKSLNPLFPMISCENNVSIIGKAVHAQMHIRSNNLVSYNAPKEKSDIEKRVEQLEELMSKAYAAEMLLAQNGKDIKKPD